MNIIPAQYKMAAKAILAVTIVFFIFSAGWTANGWRLGEQIKKAELAIAKDRENSISTARKIESLSQQLNQTNSELAAEKKAKEATQERVITREVIKYVQEPYSGHCDLPNGWVRIDSESAGGMPENDSTTSRPDDESSGFTDADALAIIVERNQVCRHEIGRLEALQNYVRGQLLIFGQH